MCIQTMHPADPLLKIGVVRKGSPDRVVTDGAQRVLGSQSGMATIAQVMFGISVKLKEAIWLLLASARQKPVDNRA